MNTRRYRLNRIALELELEASAARRRANEIAADQALVADTEASAALFALFQSDSAAAWAQVAVMTPAERTNAAIAMACYLESQGYDITWGQILDRWEAKLALRAAADEEAAEPAEEITREALGAGYFRWHGFSWAAGNAVPTRLQNGVYVVPSATKAGIRYAVAADGSRCECPGFKFRGRCRHVTAVQQRAA